MPSLKRGHFFSMFTRFSYKGKVKLTLHTEVKVFPPTAFVLWRATTPFTFSILILIDVFIGKIILHHFFPQSVMNS